MAKYRETSVITPLVKNNKFTYYITYNDKKITKYSRI